MPKSKRNKQIDLCKAKKQGIDGKKKLYNEIQSSVESYAHIFIFSVNDMRNSKLKSVREKWKHSRFFIGKNKVMALALGKSPENEFRLNLHKISERLKGECGLLFSNQSTEEVIKWFSSFSEGDFARSGNHATESVILKEGPLSQFPHNLEPYLRQLGLPTTLKKGVIHLIQDHTVCNEGEILTPETAKLLKLFGYEMAEFAIKIVCAWSQDGSFNDLSAGESNENINVMNTSKINEVISKNSDIESMEVIEHGEVDKNHEEHSNSESEDENVPILIKEDTLVVKDDSLQDNKKETVNSKDSQEQFELGNGDAELSNLEDLELKNDPDKIPDLLSEEPSATKDCTVRDLDKESETVNSKEIMLNKSPHLLEKRPKYSPKVTRSVAKSSKKEAQKISKCETEILEGEPEIQPETVRQKKAHKRHSTGESPIERKLRNRSIKIV